MGMKYLLRTVVVSALLGLLAWGMVYVSSEADGTHASSDWGIAKDSPLR